MTVPIAIITGASRGIGRAVALGLGKMGYKTILLARNQEKLQQVAAEIHAAGGPEADIFPFDLQNLSGITDVCETIRGQHPRIDVLVNNAGIHIKGTLDATPEEFSGIMATNVTAPYLLLREIVPTMRRQHSGHIFNIASRAGKHGFASTGVYSATKFALAGLSESLYRSLAADGVKVTTLCPGWVNSDMAVEAGSPLDADAMIQPEDLMQTLAWLLNLSPSACVREVIIECQNSVL